MPTTIKLKSSVVKDKVPLPSNLVIGEVAVGAHNESPALFFKDNADNIIKIEPGSGVVPSPNPPGNPGNGDLWYNETTNSLNYWNGTEWIEIGQAGDSPVTSVNGDIGEVVLDAADVGALPDTTSLDFIPLGSWALIPPLGPIDAPGRRPILSRN